MDGRSRELRLELAGVPSQEVSGQWPILLPWIERAVAYSRGRMTAGDVCAAATNADMQIWVARDGDEIAAVGITEIINYPTGLREVAVSVGGRDMAEWVPFLDVIEQWARAHGCCRVDIRGREGWERVLAPRGYGKRYVVLEKDLG